MQIKFPNFTPLRAILGPARQLGVALVVFAGMCTPTPAISGQQDVHAALLPSDSRKLAPDFQLVTADGTSVRLSDFKGKVVLLNFWATACGGCVLEIPSFIDIKKTQTAPAFTAVGVSMDIRYEGLKDADEAWSRVRPFMRKYGINYTIAMGDDGVAKDYALSALPATYLIDKSGRIAVAYVGVVVNKDNVANNIRSLLSEQ